jgi:hypothetical protein
MTSNAVAPAQHIAFSPTPLDVIESYRAAVAYMRGRNIPVPSLLAIADWQGEQYVKEHDGQS